MGATLHRHDCETCGKPYLRNPRYSDGQWLQSKFCSRECRSHGRTIRIMMAVSPTRKCNHCGKEYAKNYHYSPSQWAKSKFCSYRCQGEASKIRDGLTKGERHRRKRGILKRGSPMWLERIRARTSEAMMRPDVQLKIRAPRAAMSLEKKIKHSNALKGRMPANMRFGASHFPNVKSGWYQTTKGTIFFRSRWEANYALYLDFLIKINEIKDWEFEKDTFIFEKVKLGTRSFLPDFKVHNLDGTFEYHEVKGFMDSKSKTKLRRMEKFYPEIKLILVDASYYRDLAKRFGKMLNFY